MPQAGRAVTREKSVVMAEQPLPVLEQIPDDQNIQRQHNQKVDFRVVEKFRARFVRQSRPALAD
jgi:hypothetical protein